MAEMTSGALVKNYVRLKFSTGGGGLSFNGVAYAEGETGIKLFADAVWADGATDTIIITQNGFEGGYATGSKNLSRLELLAAIMEIIDELGFGTTGARQIMTFGDWSEGVATT